MLVESGFPIATVPHKRGLRTRGKSSNTFLPIVDFATSAVSGSAKRLLRLPVFVGLISFGIAGIMLLATLIAGLFGAPIDHWLWYSFCEFNFAMLFFFMGLIGDQIRLISERTRGTPLVVEKERVNFAPAAD